MSIDVGRYLDLAGVIVLALLPIGLIPVVGSGEIRFLITFPLLLFAPGYAIVAAFYPESGRQTDDGPTGRGSDEAVTIGPIGRFGLSVATSVAAVGLITLGANFVTGITVFPIMVGLVAVTVVAALAAALRRRMLPAESSAGVYPRRRAADGLRRYFVADDRAFGSERPFEAQTRRGVALNALIVASVVVLFSSIGFAFVMGPQTDSFSEYYLLTEQNGNTTIVDTADGVQPAQIRSLQFAVENHEGETTTYTAVVQVQRTDGSGNVQDVLSEQRYSQRVAAGDTWRQQTELSSRPEPNARAVVLFYEGGDASGDPDHRLGPIPLSSNGTASAALDPPADDPHRRWGVSD